MAFRLGFVLSLFLIWICHGVEGRRTSREEDLELEEQLEILNKPSLKVIKTEDGDILDCVDIYKQPALDNPLLRNHKIQMRPTSIPKELLKEDKASSKVNHVELKLKEEEVCPQGTVPIRRTRKKDLINAKIAKSMMTAATAKSSFRTNDEYPWIIKNVSMTRTSRHTANYPLFGAKAGIGVYNPQTKENQYSGATITTMNTIGGVVDFISAGWIVFPKLYGDNKTRLFTEWGAARTDSPGCFNTLCTGFVQIDSQLVMGTTIKPVSVLKGDQYRFKTTVFQDKVTKDWWLDGGENNQIIGYWPNELFSPSKLVRYANVVEWKGLVYNSESGADNPQMGSGNFAESGFGEACFFENIKLIYNVEFEDADETIIETYADSQFCYNVGEKTDKFDGGGYSFFFGGPGSYCKT